MKQILLPLTGIMLCAATLHSAADPAAPPQTKQGKELHAAVTDIPDVIDMSHADPGTWHSLPPGVRVWDRSPAHLPGLEEFNFPYSLQRPTPAFTVHFPIKS